MNYETLQVHAGHTPDETTLSGAVLIYQTTFHVFKNIEHAGKLFGLEELFSDCIDPTLLRVSVGIEHIDDIIADFKKALKRG